MQYPAEQTLVPPPAARYGRPGPSAPRPAGMTRTSPPRRHDATRRRVTRAGFLAPPLLAAATLLTAGCGEPPTVANTPAAAPVDQSAYQPTPAPRPPRARRPDPAPAAPVVVRDAPEEPAAEPAPPEPPPEPKIVRDNAYFAQLWASLPPPEAPLPPPLEPLPEREVRRLRAEIIDYCRKQAGKRRIRPIRPEGEGLVNAWVYDRQYRVFKEDPRKHSAEIHALLERHLQLADDLFERDDREVRETGLGVVQFAAEAAVFYLGDGRLAAAIAEAYLLPNLEHANPDQTFIHSRKYLLQTVALSLHEAEHWERYALVCGEMIRISGRDRRAADSWRTNLFQALDGQGRRAEAIAVLEDIHAPSIVGLRSYYMPEPDAEPEPDAPK